MTVRLFETPDEIGRYAASSLIGDIRKTQEGKAYLLGCPTGRTPRPIYAALVDAMKREAVDLSRLVLVMMDEYIVTDSDGALRLADPSQHFSCRGFAEREIVGPINRILPEDFRIRPENVWFPDIAAPATYDKRIAKAGGLDCFILASGSSDGHVAFNPPGSPAETETRIVNLAEGTRRDNLKSFPQFEKLDDVPQHGVSVGLKTIRSAHRCMLILWGPEKQDAFSRTAGGTAFDENWPASIVLLSPSYEILADRAAAGERG
ncbi:MAG: 6-phosphogluconolactonase [Shinella sp.]|nr:6-phosphogluconolactonase [Shinella sp.]